MLNGDPEAWAVLIVMAVGQLLVMLAGFERVNPTVVFEKAIEAGVAMS